MNYPQDENGDVLRRLEADDFDFTTPHDVEFFAIFPTEAAAAAVARQYLADHEAGDHLANVETTPTEDGEVELMLVKPMLVTYQNVTDFENTLAERVEAQGGYMDGWGVMHD